MTLRKMAYTTGAEGGRIWKIEGVEVNIARQSLLWGRSNFFLRVCSAVTTSG